MQNKYLPGLWFTGIAAALTSGTLDGLAAVYILGGGNSQMIFQYIAAGAIGRQVAFTGGRHTVLIGLGYHYLIAALFTLFFFILYGREPFFRKNAGITAFCYGIFIWVIMNFLVLPVSNLQIDINNFTFKGAITGIAILIVCVAFPIVLARYWFENQKSKAGVK